jgi:uncharacterized membrane protein YdjX (TVP38/TMEM64 family)
MSPKALIAAVIGFVALTLLLAVGIQAIGADRIRQMVEDAEPFAPLVYILIRILAFVIAPLSTGPVQFASGVMFGLVPGVIYSLIGEVIGGSINFWIARWLGRPVVRRLAGEAGMVRIEQWYHRIGEVWTLIYARVFLFAIYDFLSYAAGLSPIRFRQYFWVTLIFGVPGAFIAVFVGTQIGEGIENLLTLYAVLAVLAVIPLVFYRRIRRWFRRSKIPQEGSA